MSEIRSKRLSTGYQTTAGQYRLLKVGTNSTILVKTLTAFNATGDAADVQFWLNAGNWIVPIYHEVFTGTGSVTLETWIAMQDADELRINFNVAGVAWWVSGTLLSGNVDSTITPMDSATLLPAFQPLAAF